MHAAVLEFSLHIPSARSLKEKRAVLKPILEGCRHRFSVAAAEVGSQDRWQSAQLGVATVASTAQHVTEVLDAVERFVWSFPEVEVLSAERSWFGP